MSNALISLKPKYVQKILSGEKRIEIRRRPVSLAPDTRLWIYSTLPSGSIEAVAEIESVCLSAPCAIWDQFSSEIGISKQEFYSYVSGRKKISAIFLKKIRKIEPAPTLNCLKSKIGEFHPPQFFKHLSSGSPILDLLHSFEKRSFAVA